MDKFLDTITIIIYVVILFVLLISNLGGIKRLINIIIG